MRLGSVSIFIVSHPQGFVLFTLAKTDVVKGGNGYDYERNSVYEVA